MCFRYMPRSACWCSGLGVAAEAQQKNDRQVRDIVRSLNSRVDDFRYSLGW